MLKSLKRISFGICALALLSAIIVPSVRTAAYAADSKNAAEGQIAVTAEAEADTAADNTAADNTAADNTATVNAEEQSKGSKALAAGICVGLAAAFGAIAMGIAIAKSNEAIARQPEATSNIRSGLMLGLVFIETAIIYALIVAILVIFVL